MKDNLATEVERVAEESEIGDFRIDIMSPASRGMIEVMVSTQSGSLGVGKKFVFTDTKLSRESGIKNSAKMIVAQIENHLQTQFTQLHADVTITDTYSVSCHECGAEYTLPHRFSRRLQSKTLTESKRSLLKLILIQELQNECEPFCRSKQQRPLQNQKRSPFGVQILQEDSLFD